MVGLFFITFSNMDKLINLYGALFVLMVALSLNGCSAYFDEDGLSISPEELSEDDVRGCYFNVGSHTHSDLKDGMKLYYVECIRECFEDSVIFYFNTTIYTDSGYSKVDWLHPPESKENVENLRILHPAKQGSFLHNMQIGSYQRNYSFVKKNGHKSISYENGALLLSDDINQVGDSVCIEYWR